MCTNRAGYLKEYYARERKRIIRELKARGMWCEHGCYADLEIHHIVPLNGNRPSGQLNRLTEWKRNMDNLFVACVSCHDLLDAAIYWRDRL